MRHRRYLPPVLAAVLAAAAAAFTSCATGPVKPDAIAKGDYAYLKKLVPWLVIEKMREQGVEGLSIALVDDQEVVYAQGFGFADREKGIPATADTLYMAGSVSKLFTATAIMQLREQGKLDIDKPLVNVLPEFSIRTRFKDAGPVTVREMLTHHSGLPSDRIKGMFTKDPVDATTFVRELRDEYVATPPGTVFSYSNLSFELLGAVIEKASGRPYAAHMEDAVLGPLGMDRSGFVMRDEMKPRFARAYKDGRVHDEPPLRDVAAGGLFTSVNDLAKFVKGVNAVGAAGKPIVLPATLAEMWRPQNGASALDFDFRIGLGWILLPVRDLDWAGPVAWHNGATIYHRAALVTLPAHKLGVVILSNSASAARIGDEIAVEALKVMLETKAGLKPPRRPVEPGGERRPLTRHALEGYEGHYETVLGLTKVEAKGGYLEFKASSQAVRAYPRSDGLFALEFRLLGMLPVGVEEIEKMKISFDRVQGRDLIVMRRDGRRLLFGAKIRPRPVPEAWARRAGSYELMNKGDDRLFFDDLRLAVEDGVLLMEFSIPSLSKQQMRISLEAAGDAEAISQGLGRNKGETVRVISFEGGEALTFSGFIYRKRGP